MAGRQNVGAEIARGIEEVGELDVLVAGDAGHGRLAGRIALGEGIDHLLAELALVIEHIMRNAEARRDLAGVVDVLACAARAGAMRRLAVVVKLQGHADDVIALRLQERGDHGRVDAAGHGDDDARIGRRLGQVERVQGLRHGRSI